MVGNAGYVNCLMGKVRKADGSNIGQLQYVPRGDSPSGGRNRIKIWPMLFEE